MALLFYWVSFMQNVIYAECRNGECCGTIYCLKFHEFCGILYIILTGALSLSD
jgi:hypothetical protein